MVPPTIAATPTTIANFLFMFLSKNFELTRGVSVGGDPSEFHEIDDNDEEWREGVNPSGGGEDVSVAIRSNPESAGDAGAPDDPGLEKREEGGDGNPCNNSGRGGGKLER